VRPSITVCLALSAGFAQKVGKLPIDEISLKFSVVPADPERRILSPRIFSLKDSYEYF
jgi:hypothetical protein